MLARHAEALFWSGRYLERAEDTVRMLDVAYHGSLEASPARANASWGRLLETLRLRAEFDRDGRELDEAAVLRFLVLERDNPGSIVSSVAAVRENFRALREQLPAELWEHANRFHLHLSARNLHRDLERQPYELYDLVKLRCQTLAGIVTQAMPRDDGYRFLVTGSMLERALMTSRLVHVRFPGLMQGSTSELAQTLRSVSALEEYRKQWRASTESTHVVAFLLQSETFPRSVLFCLQRAERLLALLDAPPAGARNRTLRLLGQLRSQLEFADPEEIVDQLESYLETIEDGVRHVAESMAAQYFRSSEEFSHNTQYLLPGEARL